jgi:hypothetical protein
LLLLSNLIALGFQREVVALGLALFAAPVPFTRAFLEMVHRSRAKTLFANEVDAPFL